MQASKFEVAEKLAEAACMLDTAKMGWPDIDQDGTRELSEKMYDMADALAGDRAEELYSKVGAGCSGGPGWEAL